MFFVFKPFFVIFLGVVNWENIRAQLHENQHDVFIPSWQSVVAEGSAIPLFGPPPGAAWTLRSADGVYANISAQVPGDVLTDLIKAGIIDDPYYDRNFLTQSRVWMGEPHPTNRTTSDPSPPKEPLQERTRTWIYTTQFSWFGHHDVTDGPGPNISTLLLVVEGIKMGAAISINGVPLEPNVTDQFLRYIYSVPRETLDRAPSHLHELSVVMDAQISTDGRFSACSGGWDWAPYTRAGDGRGSRVWSLGIFQPIYLVPVQSAFITAIVPKIYYLGPYPRQPLLQAPVGDFQVDIHIHVHALSLQDPWMVVVQTEFSQSIQRVPIVTTGQSTVVISLIVPKDAVRLWWPNGEGAQPLYAIDCALENSQRGTRGPWLRKRIGFRTIALVTSNEMERLPSPDEEGSGQHGMYFRINGAIVYARGANFVPMDQLEGRWSDQAHKLAVYSAATAHMNMLRVWGGGAVLPNAFYDASDESGILIYHDLMFVGEQNHSAFRTQIIRDEIAHIVQKLASHTSIVLWSGCNECTYNGGSMEIYESFVLQTVAEEDDSRPIWPSSPSECGWETGVHTLDGRPNGNLLKVRNSTGCTLESHGPYQRGYSESHPGVNDLLTSNTYETFIPPKFPEHNTGPAFRNIFVSEFGSSVSSSFESMSAFIPSSAWSMHGGGPPDRCIKIIGQENVCTGNNSMAERNYPCDNRIISFFGNISLDEVGPESFRRQLYMCMIAQTLWMKGHIEAMRSSNSFGSLIWQLNEVWPTGGWGLLEYGPNGQSRAQISGGRWKPLMYLLKKSMYTSVVVACGEGGRCYARNDGLSNLNVTILVEAWDLWHSNVTSTSTIELYLEGGAHSTHRFQLPSSAIENADVGLIEAMEVKSGRKVVEDAGFLWQAPKSIMGLNLMVHLWIKVFRAANGVELELESDRLAMYLVLSTEAPGIFSDNALHLRPFQRRSVFFRPLEPGADIPWPWLVQTLRVQHMGNECETKIILVGDDATPL